MGTQSIVVAVFPCPWHLEVLTSRVPSPRQMILLLKINLSLIINQDRRRQWHLTPVLLPGKSHGQRSMVGCSPWGLEESDMTERLHFHFSLSCIGEGNGNPLQSSCLENPREAGPGGLPSMGSHWVGHDWSDLAAAAALIRIYFSPTPVWFYCLPSLWGICSVITGFFFVCFLFCNFKILYCGVAPMH